MVMKTMKTKVSRAYLHALNGYRLGYSRAKQATRNCSLIQVELDVSLESYEKYLNHSARRSKRWRSVNAFSVRENCTRLHAWAFTACSSTFTDMTNSQTSTRKRLVRCS